jgi:hypothetical protein
MRTVNARNVVMSETTVLHRKSSVSGRWTARSSE